MQEGFISKWQEDRGFGFIQASDGTEIFFHISNWQGDGRPGQGMKVRFVNGQDSQGRKEAKEVVPLSGQILPGGGSSNRVRRDADFDDESVERNGSDWGFKAMVFLAAFAAAFFLWDRVQTGWLNESKGPGIGFEQPVQSGRQPDGFERPLSNRNYPQEVYQTLRLIYQNGPFPHRQDGRTFQNRERRLPSRPAGYYREYTVETPGARDRGAKRIVTGGQPPTEYYYTDNHYRSFERMELDRD
jgi:guanyl-specific ribonuclease Sa/cold shock CspA family protein